GHGVHDRTLPEDTEDVHGRDRAGADLFSGRSDRWGHGHRDRLGIRCADRCFNSGLRQSGVQDAESDQQARGGEKRDELNSFASRKESFRPISLAMKPTRSAAMMVPSRTPSSRPAKMSESTVAITVRDTSKATFVVPNSVFHVEETARTKDSPGSMATFARTSVYTPNPRIRQPVRR